MKKRRKRGSNSIHPAQKEFVMYAVFRRPKDKYPKTIYNRASHAKHEVFCMKDYWWGNEAFYRRIIVKMRTVTLYDIYKHERKII